MSNIAVRVENLSKQYKIGAAKRSHDTLRDHLTEGFKSFFRRNGRQTANGVPNANASWSSTSCGDTIWALRDVSFEVEQGEAIGIIGRNGAGKSTLLKILSHITEPTTGFAEVHGRMSSLLEVGTGFHAELTGRENIYLNGAILGMRKTEIDRKFDEITAFSEVEKFIDTPVKHYSSGMYVRLAFAVAAHLEPEILIVDEVLAVGDAAFQKKCLGKMNDVAKEGRTVLFVSHNMAAVEHLCQRVIVLQQGTPVFSGNPKEAISHYIASSFGGEEFSQSHIFDLSGAKSMPGCRPLLKRLELYTGGGKALNGGLQMGASLEAHIYLQLENPPGRLNVGLAIDNLLGQRIFSMQSAHQMEFPRENGTGEQILICEVPHVTLIPGEYRIKVGLAIDGLPAEAVENAARFTVVASDYYGTGKIGWTGFVVMSHRWYLKEATRI
jgi:lipopolysaccharide transport system ATP-binding protein